MKLSEVFGKANIFFNKKTEREYEKVKDEDCIIAMYDDRLNPVIIKTKGSFRGVYSSNDVIRVTSARVIYGYFKEVGVVIHIIDKKLWQEYQDYLLIEDL